MLEALKDAIREERSAAQHGIPVDGQQFLADLYKQGYIFVRNTEPSEYGFNCHMCGCEYPGHKT